MLAALVGFLPGCRPPDPAKLATLTDAHTRVVWVQDRSEAANDVFALGENLVLMAACSRERNRGRVVLRTPDNYAKPLITPDGERIVFSNRRTKTIHIVDWSGANLRVLRDGYALDVWRAPGSGEFWVYFQDGNGTDNRQPIRRFPLGDPENAEPVWSATAVDVDSFQVSDDGMTAAGLFPWPRAAFADLSGGDLVDADEGCWPALAPHDANLMWVFDGAHRNLRFFTRGDEAAPTWTVCVNDVPELAGHEVYHPRWSNHPRIIAVTGPYKIEGGGNFIRGGGREIEIFVGRLAADLRSVEAWRKVTANDAPDFYPDVWVGDGDTTAAPPHPTATAAGAGPLPPANTVTVEAVLVEPAVLPDPASLAPYRRALGCELYDVTGGGTNDMPAGRIAVARWMIRDAAVIAGVARIAGQSYRLNLRDFDRCRELQGERLLADTLDPLIPLFYEVPPEPAPAPASPAAEIKRP